jgi:phospholipase C
VDGRLGKWRRRRWLLGSGALASVAAVVAVSTTTSASETEETQFSFARSPDKMTTATPIKLVVVIFRDNVSFDDFGTYPNATNANATRSRPRPVRRRSMGSPNSC